MARIDTPADPLAEVAFEVERFEWTMDDRLEVVGRWFGVRGRRFVRPTLHVRVDGRRRRLIAVLDHKPWAADTDENWTAAFAWRGSHEGVSAARLEVAPDVVLDLPLPGDEAVGASLTPRPRREARATPGLGAPPDPRDATGHRSRARRVAAGHRAPAGRDRSRPPHRHRRSRSPPAAEPSAESPPAAEAAPAELPPAAEAAGRVAAGRRGRSGRVPPAIEAAPAEAAAGHRGRASRIAAGRRGRSGRSRRRPTRPLRTSCRRPPRPLRRKPPAADAAAAGRRASAESPPVAEAAAGHRAAPAEVPPIAAAPASLATGRSSPALSPRAAHPPPRLVPPRRGPIITLLALQRRLVEERAERERLADDLAAAREQIAALTSHHDAAVERSREVVRLEGELVGPPRRPRSSGERVKHRLTSAERRRTRSDELGGARSRAGRSRRRAHAD